MNIRNLLRAAVPAGLVVLSLMVSLLLGELLARLVVNPGDFLVATLVDDPILGHRISPHTTGHDALGFRNAAVPERARIVVIGDSQTYGFGAARADSWPAQLGALLGEPVYNMALGGYGPLDYYYLAGHDAQKLAPELLLIGLYLGNDLMDAYSAAYERDYWRQWRGAAVAAGGDFEDRRPVEKSGGKRFGALRDWLARHSVLYSVLRVTLLSWLSLSEKDRAAVQAPSDRMMVWSDPAAPGVRTIFTPHLRLAALDPKLPRVREGLRVARKALVSLKTLAAAKGTRLIVVLIPTKERVYCPYLKSAGKAMPDAFAGLCEAEDSVKGEVVQTLTEEKIPFVDATGFLEEQVLNHAQIYPMDADGHPRASGHGAIARAVSLAVRGPAPGKP